MISTQNVKSFRCDLKHGLGLQDLCAKHGCTEDQLEANIRTLYKSNADSILKQLRRNDHRQSKLRRKPHIQPTTEIISLSIGSSDDQPAEPTLAEQIADLKVQEQAALDSAFAYNTHLQGLQAQQESCLREFSVQQGCLKRLQQTVQDLHQQITKLSDQYEAIQTDIHTARSFLEINQSHAAELREQIDDLEKIVILAYSDGEIEPIDGTDIVLNDTGNDKIYSSLITRDDCADLRIRDLRTIARVISIVNNAPVRVVPLFEDEGLTACFQNLHPDTSANISSKTPPPPEPNLN